MEIILLTLGAIITYILIVGVDDQMIEILMLAVIVWLVWSDRPE